MLGLLLTGRVLGWLVSRAATKYPKFHDVATKFNHLAKSGHVDQELVDVCGVAASGV